MIDRPRLPRLTVGRFMALMVPTAAHLALARWLLVEADLPAWAIVLIPGLLALIGLAVAGFRRATFLGLFVQMTVALLASLALVAGVKEGPSHSVPSLALVLAAVLAMVSHLVRHLIDPGWTPAGLWGVLWDALEAALASLGLMVIGWEVWEYGTFMLTLFLYG